MDILFAFAGVAGTIVFAVAVFTVAAIIIDLARRTAPSLTLVDITPWLTGATFIGFVFLNAWSGWAWFWWLGWASVALTAAAFVLKHICHHLAASGQRAKASVEDSF